MFPREIVKPSALYISISQFAQPTVNEEILLFSYIHRNTAFAWRYKLLDGLQQLAKQTKLDGILRQTKHFSDYRLKETIRRVPSKCRENPVNEVVLPIKWDYL
jgi:hypothetical protein